MQHRPQTPGPRWLVSALIALTVALAASVGAVAAQDAPPEIDFRVAKYTCEEDPGSISPIADNAPADCELTAGVTFTIEVVDTGAELTCTTDASGQCAVKVPSEAEVIVTEDTDTAPDGYAPRENPIETTAVTEFAGAVFVNLPEETPELPKTGVGTGVVQSSLTGLLAAVATVLLLAGHQVRRAALRR